MTAAEQNFAVVFGVSLALVILAISLFLAAAGFQAAPPSTCSRPPTAWDAGPAGDCP